MAYSFFSELFPISCCNTCFLDSMHFPSCTKRKKLCYVSSQAGSLETCSPPVLYIPNTDRRAVICKVSYSTNVPSSASVCFSWSLQKKKKKIKPKKKIDWGTEKTSDRDIQSAKTWAEKKKAASVVQRGGTCGGRVKEVRERERRWQY